MEIDTSSLPVGADPSSDPVVGMDDTGAPVYQSTFGAKYIIRPTMRQGGSVIRGAWNALRQDPSGTMLNALGGIAQGVANGIMAPSNALAGKPMTNADLWNVSGLMMGGGGAMAAPSGALRSGALRTAADGLTPAQQAAEDVLTRLRTGQAATVTDEMMAAADPQHLYANYDLPMDAASRAARAKDMGFGGNWLHATAMDAYDTPASLMDDWSSFNGGNVWLSEANKRGYGHADEFSAMRARGTDKAPAVLPLRVKGPESRVDWDDHVAATANEYGIDPPTEWNQAQAMVFGDEPGAVPPPASGVQVFEYYPDMDQGRHRINAGIADPANIRSQFARFDPRLSHLKNLSAGLAAIGLTNLASMFDPEGSAQ